MTPRRIGQGHLQFTPLEKKYVQEVLESNRLSAGPFTERFEAQFAARHGCGHAIMINSGTSALHISIAVLKELGGWKDGDEVLVPASTFVATSNTVIHNRLTPIFVDIDPATYNINPPEIESHRTPKTRAILPAHMYGQPCDMDAIMALAERHRLRVIEDSCECMAASFRGRSVGSFGDLSCFSTYVAHILTTGVGGIIATSNDEYATVCRSMMAHGRDPAYLRIDHDDLLDDPERLSNIVAKRFNFIWLGHSFRTTELQAALGLGQLAQLDEMIAARRKNAEAFTRRLGPLSEKLQLPEVAPHREHSFMMYPIVCRDGVDRDRLVNHLEQAGIETRFMMPLLSQPIYRKLFGETLEEQYPVAKRVTHQGFYLPCHHGLTAEDIEYMARAIERFF